MEVKCEYCGSLIPDDAPKCPNCGATNENMHRSVDHTPKTIAELEQWYKDRNLPPYDVTRFFIGINYEEPKAFGIYQDGERFIVYKNKSDGERAIRYQGTDEDYAVNEIYLKLKSEILAQKAHNTKNQPDYKHMDLPKGNPWTPPPKAPKKKTPSKRSSGVGSIIKKIIFGAVIAFVLVCIGFAIFGKDKATYYSYNNIPYMYYGGAYYIWDEEEDFYQKISRDEVPESLLDDRKAYQINRDSDDVYYYDAPDSEYTWHGGASNWNNNYFDSDDDHDYDWDDGGNDSGNGGWDSDYGNDWDSDW